MRYIKEYNEYKDIDTICKEHHLEDYTINPDGTVDANGLVSLINKLKKLPLKFNRIVGDFYCRPELITLEGSPIEVDGSFCCYNNHLTTLKGAPKLVSGDYNCCNNQLTTLKGAPKEVESFICNNNKLTTLEGGPERVVGNFACHNNKLTTLEGGPKEVGGDFICHNNKLTSLKGAPKELGGDFICHDNPLPNLIMDNLRDIKYIIKWQDEYSIWKPDGGLDEFKFKQMMQDK